MLWYSEVILADIMVTEKRSDMERRHGSPCIITSHSFFFFLTTLKCLSQSPMKKFGGNSCLLWLRVKEKTKTKKRNLDFLAICPEKKMPVGGMLQARVHQLHNLN